MITVLSESKDENGSSWLMSVSMNDAHVLIPSRARDVTHWRHPFKPLSSPYCPEFEFKPGKLAGDVHCQSAGAFPRRPACSTALEFEVMES